VEDLEEVGGERRLTIKEQKMPGTLGML
jgi:hypothetical protein